VTCSRSFLSRHRIRYSTDGLLSPMLRSKLISQLFINLTANCSKLLWQQLKRSCLRNSWMFGVQSASSCQRNAFVLRERRWPAVNHRPGSPLRRWFWWTPKKRVNVVVFAANFLAVKSVGACVSDCGTGQHADIDGNCVDDARCVGYCPTSERCFSIIAVSLGTTSGL